MTTLAAVHARRLAAALLLAFAALLAAPPRTPRPRPRSGPLPIHLHFFPDICGGEGGDPVETAPRENTYG